MYSSLVLLHNLIPFLIPMVSPFGEIEPSYEFSLDDLAKMLNCPKDLEKANRIARATLHTLRAHLSLDDAISVLKLLPLPLKRIFIENWNLKTAIEPPFGIKSFIHDVQVSAGRIAFYDFPTEEATDFSIRTVLQYVELKISEHSKEQFRELIPLPLRSFLPPKLPINLSFMSQN